MLQNNIQSIDDMIAEIATERDPEAFAKLIEKQFNKIYRQNPTDGLKLARAAYRLAKSRGERWGMAHATCCEGVAHNNIGDCKSAAVALRRAIGLFEKVDDQRGNLKAHNHISNAYFGLGRFEESAAYATQGIALARILGHRLAEALMLRILGSCSFTLGDSLKGLEYLLESVSILREIGESAWEGRVVGNIAAVYGALDQKDLALEYLLRALELQKDAPADTERVSLLENIGLAYHHVGEHERGVVYLKEGLELAEMIGNIHSQSGIHGLLGILYYYLNEFEAAESHLSKSLTLMEQVGSTHNTTELVRTAGLVYGRLGKYQEAIDCFFRALEYARRDEDPKLIYQLHYDLAFTYKNAGEYVLSTEYFVQHGELRDVAMAAENRKTIAEMQAKFDLAQAEKEKELALLKAAQLEQQVDHRARELAALELNLKGREELLDLLQNRIQSGLTKKRDDPAMVLRDMLREIDREKNMPQNYTSYISRIDQMQEEFYRSLTQRFPKLTPAELKICSLMRGNMSTKEIADLLCVTTRNVETHRYHIRQKMGLPKETHLTTFLATL